MGQSRRVIKLDLAAISQLLAFDEVSRMMDRTVRRAAREKNKTSALFGFRKLFRPISTFFVKASLKSGRGTHFGKSSETANDRDSAHKTFRQKGRVVNAKRKMGTQTRPLFYRRAISIFFKVKVITRTQFAKRRFSFEKKIPSIVMCIFNGFSSFNRRKIMIAFIILKVRRPSHLKLWIMRSLRFRIAKFCGTTTMPFWVRSNEPTFYISSIFALLSKRSILLPWNWHKDLCGEGVDFKYSDVSTFVRRIMIEKPWIVLPSYKYLEA